MAETITIPDLENGKVDIDTLADIVNLQEPTTETRLSGPVNTWFGVQSSITSANGLGYITKADMDSAPGTVEGQLARVTDDGENTGLYIWSGSAWVKTTDPVEAYYAALLAMIQGKLDRNVFTMPGYLFAVADKNGNLSDLAVDDETGEFADFVVRRLKRRINGIVDIGDAVYPQTKGSTHEIVGGDFYNRNGEILPVLTDMTKLAGWGSSSMERSATAMAALATEFGMTYFNGGIGGQTTPLIAARIGSIPAKVTFPGNTIPASGTGISVTVTGTVAHASQDYLVTVGGVEGRLYYSSGAKFDRTTAGEAVNIEPETPLLPIAGANNRAGINVLWMGRNDLNGDEGRVEQCVQNTDSSFDWFSPMVCRRLVMSHFTGALEPSDPVFQQILQVNAAHKKRYGNLFIDVQAYLSSAQVWTDTGLTPTSADTDAQAVGTTPPSLLADSLHLTPLAYTTIVQKLVKQRMLDLGWFYLV